MINCRTDQQLLFGHQPSIGRTEIAEMVGLARGCEGHFKYREPGGGKEQMKSFMLTLNCSSHTTRF